MAENGVSIVRSVLELAILLAALGIIFGGLALIIFLSPWSRVILDRLVALDLGFAIELVVYLVIAAIIVLLSVLTVYSRNIVHSALYLLGTFAGVAALYISINAPFLGVAQVLVYIGAVGVLILFAVMLTRKTIVEESHGEV